MHYITPQADGEFTLLRLKENRKNSGGNLGKHMADRFIDVWYSSKKNPLKHEEKFYKERVFGSSKHLMNHIDKELKKLNLINIFTSYKGYIAVKPVKNWKNSFISKSIKSYLIIFIGDKPQYYKDLLEQSKK